MKLKKAAAGAPAPAAQTPAKAEPQPAAKPAPAVAAISAAAGATLPSTEAWYFVKPGGERGGPSTLEELKQLLAAKSLAGQDRVWRAGFEAWRPVEEVPELAASLAPAAYDDFQVPVDDSVRAGAAAAHPSPGNAGMIDAAVVPLAGGMAAKTAAPQSFADIASEPTTRLDAWEDGPAKPRRPNRFLTWMHTTLPKPVLFGLYGGVGGLLAVLILGELIWLLIHPKPPVFEPLKVAVPPTVTVYPSSFNRLTVKIARHRFEGPVHVSASNLPQGVQITAMTIPKGENEVALAVRSGESVVPEVRQVQLHFKAEEDESIKAMEIVRLAVEPLPPRLQLNVSPAVIVYEGYQNRIGFSLARERFEGPLRLEVLDLPKGVHIPLVPLDEKTTEGFLDIRVDKGTEVGRKTLEVEVHSMLSHKTSARAKLELNIEPAPGKLQIAVSPSITVYPKTRNSFTAKVARSPEVKGAVELEVEGAPDGVDIPSITIPEDKSEGEFTVSADKATAESPTTHNLRLNARVKVAEKITASLPFQLVLAPPPPTIQLAVAPKVPVYPGGKASFSVKIARNRFKGPVVVGLLPGGGKGGKGLPLANKPSIVIPEGESEGQIEMAVAVSALALPANYTANLPVYAHSQAAPAIAAKEDIEVELLAPPSDLALTVAPEVEVYQGGKCFFRTRIARTGFIGAVKLQFLKLPEGVTLTPTSFGPTATEVTVSGAATMDAPPGKYTVEVQAEGTKAPDGKIPSAKEEFTLIVKPADPSKRPPLDIVFVLDVTKSMDPQIAGIRDGVQSFIGKLNDKKLDARIGLVAFRDILFDKESERMELLDFGGSPFTGDYKKFSAEVGKLKAKGGGDDPESSLDGILESLKYPFRPKALKIVLLVTDAPFKEGKNLTSIEETKKALLAKGVDQVHLIMPDEFLKLYTPLWDATKSRGKSFNLGGDARTTAAGFANLLPTLSDEIVKITPVGDAPAVSKDPPAPPKAKEPPSLAGEKVPAPPAETSVAAAKPAPPSAPTAGRVDPIQAAAPTPPAPAAVNPPTPPPTPTLQGVQSDQMYADEDRWQLLIAVALWTAILAAGIALMLVAAQKRYLTQMRLTIKEAGKAFGAGLGAGLFAGLIGQWFFQSTSGSAWWIVVSRVIAWTMLGGLIGAGMSFFVPNLQWKRAFTGGLIGGFVGAVAFALVSALSDAMLGRWIGALLLGICIGLMVALAEMAFRRYWLEVAFGEREIRTVNLGPDAVSLGGDEKLVGVYVPEAAPRALGYRVDRDKVLCEDYPAGRTTECAPGDVRPLSRAKIRVCSAASASPTGITLQLILPRNVSLMDGMPLTADDIPMLEPQGSDGVVALVSKRPTTPVVFLLRNRSKQTWTVSQADGTKKEIGPGLSIELTSRCEVNFGKVKGILEPADLDDALAKK